MTCTFAAYSPGTPTAGADGMEVPAWTPHGTTAGKVSGNSLISHDTSMRSVVVGLVQRPILEGTLHLPLDATLPAIGWEYVCTAVGADVDPAMVGTRWHVTNVPVESYPTARRLTVVRL